MFVRNSRMYQSCSSAAPSTRSVVRPAHRAMAGSSRSSAQQQQRTMSMSMGSGKAFGGVTYMNKEEHERERTRWISRMEEIETRLAESETLNSDMNQIKAELNKKIVELERNQRPLIEANRKLTDRNRNLMQELKRMESKIAHQMDDFLTLRDSHERVVKENALLRKERTFPEKLEELDRYRNQVLEYSKCITALRQAGLEKDRRYEVLVVKLKRLRRAVRGEEDRQSTVGSDCSAESSISLDTITEDLEETVSKELQSNYEALYRENEELARALHVMGGDDASLREELAVARTRIAQQQAMLDERADCGVQYRQTITRQSEQLSTMEEEVERLQRELTMANEQRDLLEFQVIEMQCGNEHTRQASSSTDEESYEIEVPLQKLTYQEICDLKADIRGLRRANNLMAAQKRSVSKAYMYLESLEMQWIEHEATCPGVGKDLNGNNAKLLEEVCDLSKELGQVRYQLQTAEDELKKEKKRVDELEGRLSASNQPSEFADLEDSMKRQMEELEGLREAVEENKKKLQLSEAERIRLQGDLNVVRAECQRLRDDQRPAIKTDLERRFEETRYRLKEALNKIEKYENVIDAAKRVDENRSSYADELEKELEEVKEYNAHMERQFKTQTDIINTLKQRVISSKSAFDFLNTLPSLNATKMQRAMMDYTHTTHDEDAKKTVLLIADIVDHCLHDGVLDSLKLRECRSTDSGGDSLSNGSSSGRHSDDEEWQRSHGSNDLRQYSLS